MGGLSVVVQVGGLAAGVVAQTVRGIGGLLWCRQGAGLCRQGVLRGPRQHIGYPGVCCCAMTAACSEGYLRGRRAPSVAASCNIVTVGRTGRVLWCTQDRKVRIGGGQG
jgi:hypothetical protein